ncbi:MAG: DUF262 domain-containing protein [Pseudomonadota bacterium]
MARRHNFQTISWFWDLFRRDLLVLDPPYQRRSVWNQNFKDYFVETILLQYPAPAIFLFEEISTEGRSVYNVVDGKQRLTTLFEFVRNEFAVFDRCELESVRGKYFEELPDNIRIAFWSYQLTVEYLPQNEEPVLNSVFDRINRNVAKLSPQELRHARFSGEFISLAEELAGWMEHKLPRNFPNIASQSRRQMKEVELVAQLLLLIEEGPRGYTQIELDEAFAVRDETWDAKPLVEELFRAAIDYIARLIIAPEGGHDLSATRLRNQADFYSLFGAIVQLVRESTLPALESIRNRLSDFIRAVDDDSERQKDEDARNYYESGRSASNLKAQRERRIAVIGKRVLGDHS